MCRCATRVCPNRSCQCSRGAASWAKKVWQAAIVVLVVGRAAYAVPASTVAQSSRAFLERHCVGCHDATTKEGGLDLTALLADGAAAGADSGKAFHAWVRVHDRIISGEMPPEGEDRPDAADAAAYTAALDRWLVAVDEERIAVEGRARSRRLTAAEYESALRDLLALPALSVRR